MKCKHQITVDPKGIIKLDFEDFVRDCVSANINVIFYDKKTNYLVNYVYWTHSVYKKREDTFLAIIFVTEISITPAPNNEYRKYIVYSPSLDSIEYVDGTKEVDFSNQGESIMVLKDAKAFREVMKVVNKIGKEK